MTCPKGTSECPHCGDCVPFSTSHASHLGACAVKQAKNRPTRKSDRRKK